MAAEDPYALEDNFPSTIQTLGNEGFSTMGAEDPYALEDNNPSMIQTLLTGGSSTMVAEDPYVFEDNFPCMIQRLGTEGFMGELCNGFFLLMDVSKGVITFESLRRNSLLLGLEDLRDEEIIHMLAEGDLDGDGALNQKEFCVLMFRLSPALMDGSRRWVEEMLSSLIS